MAAGAGRCLLHFDCGLPGIAPSHRAFWRVFKVWVLLGVICWAILFLGAYIFWMVTF
jgi:hypothetical protein